MEDNKIIDLFWNRDEDAIKHTEMKYGAYCHTIALNILSIQEDAEECKQSVGFTDAQDVDGYNEYLFDLVYEIL